MDGCLLDGYPSIGNTDPSEASLEVCGVAPMKGRAVSNMKSSICRSIYVRDT